jgi:hypothetical protein
MKMKALSEINILPLTPVQSAAARRRSRLVPLLTAVLLPLGITLMDGNGPIEAAGATEPAAMAGMPMPSDALIAKVRAVTQQFQTVAAAKSEGYIQGTPCVSGPDRGAMGIHYVRLDLIENAVLDVNQPSALIYEPEADGTLRLVGVEYLVFAEVWNSNNPNTPPALEGNLLNYIPFPNRYGLPAIYEIHVWAWKANPLGSNADWNTHVTCDHQPLAN